jgi:hypothetical protein
VHRIYKNYCRRSEGFNDGEIMMKEDYVNIGKRLPCIDGIVKATGKAKFAGDLSVFDINDDSASAMAHATVALYK